MKVRILHLSDLHFKAASVAQNVVVSSLEKAIQKLDKKNLPNMLIITGDIAYSGKNEEYDVAKTFIDKIVKMCSISEQHVFIIPGNHDVDRSKIKEEHREWWYNIKDEKTVATNLSSDISLPFIIAKTSAYFEFVKYYNSNVKIERHGNFSCSVGKQGDNEIGIKIVGLNSSLFCGFDGDDHARLALGFEQVSECDISFDSTKEIVITCVHHPFNCFHLCEKPVLNIVKRFSDLILSGHLHEPNNILSIESNSGQTVFVNAGAAYENREHENSFNLIDIDTVSLKGQILFYKYLPKEHDWIINKDINHAKDGVFEFSIPRDINAKQLTNRNSNGDTNITSRYMLVLDTSFDELNREKVNAIISHLKSVTSDVNATMIKMEPGSVKIYFETTNEALDAFNDVSGLRVIKLTKLESDSGSREPFDRSVFHWKTFLKPGFNEIISNPGASFTHSRADNLKLRDLYVSPNLVKIELDGRKKFKTEKITNAEDALNKRAGEKLKVVVFGSDVSGKSTLLRWFYDKFYGNGFIPILVNGSSIKDVSVKRIKKLVKEEFNNQYSGVLSGSVDDYDPDRIILLIDDLHRVRFAHAKFKVNLIANIEKTFVNTFITCNELMRFENITSKGGDIFSDFNSYQILEFGPKHRFELIKKWNGLGSEQLEPNELIRLNNETESYVESIIGKNFVPSYPIYILTILQAREANSVQKPEFSLHGFYYELLINDALNKAVRNKDDISLFYNFITDYAFFIFTNQIRQSPIELSSFIQFHDNYCAEYKIDVSHKLILDTLIASRLLSFNDRLVSFSYKYVYYYFVARYLANHTSDNQIRLVIKSLCQRVHRDEFASIVMFLTHLSKDQLVISELLENSKSQFSDIAPLKFDNDVLFINEMINKLPQEVYEPIDVEAAKEEELREEEELDRQEREFNSSKEAIEYDLNEDVKSLDVLSRIIRAVKTIEIVGQVTKKYWGGLKAQQKYELAEETYMLGLRSLGFYFGLIGSNSDLLVTYLNQIYRRKNVQKAFSRQEIDQASRRYLFSLCAMATYGIVKKVTYSIGYEKLAGTFQDILKTHNSNSVKLIDTSIKLDHNKQFPWDEVKALKRDVHKYFLPNVVLQRLVINYLYVFHTSIEEKQRICSLLDIKMDEQRYIEATSTIKKDSKRK